MSSAPSIEDQLRQLFSAPRGGVSLPAILTTLIPEYLVDNQVQNVNEVRIEDTLTVAKAAQVIRQVLRCAARLPRLGGKRVGSRWLPRKPSSWCRHASAASCWACDAGRHAACAVWAVECGQGPLWRRGAHGTRHRAARVGQGSPAPGRYVASRSLTQHRTRDCAARQRPCAYQPILTEPSHLISDDTNERL